MALPARKLWVGLQRVPDFVLALDAQRSVGEGYGQWYEFKAGTKGPDLFAEQWGLFGQPSLVPRSALWFDSGKLNFGHEFSSIHTSSPGVDAVLTGEFYQEA
jgi:hypothetical protein